MLCEKFSTKSWLNCIKDERSHRVSTDDYDCHSENTERNDESEEMSWVELILRSYDLVAY